MTATSIHSRVKLIAGDCIAGMASMPAESIDACVTDGPYFLPEIAKRFGSASSAKAKDAGDTPYGRGAMAAMHGKADIFSDICNRVETWEAVYRVLKPGAFCCAFNAPKAFAHMQIAIERAGFEVRDVVPWHYATGMPHGKPLGKMIDKRVLGAWCDADELARGPVSHSAAFYAERDIALKPASEFIVYARKPLAGTLADNLIAYGTGSIDVTSTRIAHATGDSYPANMMHDGSPEIMAGFPLDARGHSVGRFFWHPKADDADRGDSKHPTVKPIGLVREIVKSVTTPGQIVLDPFAGSGTTGAACVAEGRHAVLIEIDPEFQREIMARMAALAAGPDERERQKIKAKAGAPFEAGTLFAGLEA